MAADVEFDIAGTCRRCVVKLEFFCAGGVAVSELFSHLKTLQARGWKGCFGIHLFGDHDPHEDPEALYAIIWVWGGNVKSGKIRQQPTGSPSALH